MADLKIQKVKKPGSLKISIPDEKHQKETNGIWTKIVQASTQGTIKATKEMIMTARGAENPVKNVRTS